MYFGEFEDDEVFPVLKNWSWRSDWQLDTALDSSNFDDWIVYGSGPDNEYSASSNLTGQELDDVLMGYGFPKVNVVDGFSKYTRGSVLGEIALAKFINVS